MNHNLHRFLFLFYDLLDTDLNHRYYFDENITKNMWASPEFVNKLNKCITKEERNLLISQGDPNAKRISKNDETKRKLWELQSLMHLNHVLLLNGIDNNYEYLSTNGDWDGKLLINNIIYFLEIKRGLLMPYNDEKEIFKEYGSMPAIGNINYLDYFNSGLNAFLNNFIEEIKIRLGLAEDKIKNNPKNKVNNKILMLNFISPAIPIDINIKMFIKKIFSVTNKLVFTSEIFNCIIINFKILYSEISGLKKLGDIYLIHNN